MRKRAGLFLLLTAVLIFCLLTFFRKTTDYNDAVVSTNEYKKMINDRIEFLENSDFAVYFDEQKLVYSSRDNIFYYSLNEGNKRAKNPGIRAYSGNKKINVAFLEEYINENLIANNNSINILLYDNDYYMEAMLKCTTLPVINIISETPIESEEDVPVTINVYDNEKGALNRVTDSEGTIRIRGGYTRNFPKKSYRINLDTRSLGENKRKNEISLLGLNKSSDWILYADYNDQEKIRNVFSQNLWYDTCARDNKYGICAGTRYKFTEVFLNGNYYGMYALGEVYDENTFSMTPKSEENVLYNKQYWNSESEIQMFNESLGGYRTSGMNEYEKSESDIIDYSFWEMLLDYYSYLEDNRHDSEALLKAVDEDNIASFFAFINLIQGSDNVMDCNIKNLFLGLYKRDDVIEGIYAPWDMDMAWGNYFTGDLSKLITEQYGVSPLFNTVFDNTYVNQLIYNNDNELCNKIYCKYKELRKEKWSEENLIKILDEYEKQIYYSGAFLREREAWPGGNYNSPSKGLSDFKDYVLKRLAACDEYFERFIASKDENVYVRRSSKYQDFTDSKFIFEINDKSYLDNPEFVEFMKYLDLPVEKITEKTRYITGSKSLGYEFYNELGTIGDYLETNIGTIGLERLQSKIDDLTYWTDEYYTLTLDGVICYDTILTEYVPVRCYFVASGERGENFDFTSEQNMSVQIASFNDMSLYLKMLKYVDGEITVNINNPMLLEDETLKDRIDSIKNNADERINVSVEENFSDETDTGEDVHIVIERDGEKIDDVFFSFEYENKDGKTKAYQTGYLR